MSGGDPASGGAQAGRHTLHKVPTIQRRYMLETKAKSQQSVLALSSQIVRSTLGRSVRLMLSVISLVCFSDRHLHSSKLPELDPCRACANRYTSARLPQIYVSL